MRKSWSLAVAVIAVGAIAGAAIAGRPVPSDPFVLDPSITVPTAVTSTTEVFASTPTTKPSQPTITATTIAQATTTSTPRSTTGTTTSTSVSATVASTISTTTATTTTTTAAAGPLPRDQVRLVIANGDGRFRLASITADRIRPLGYQIDLGDTLQKVPATIVYYRPGFDDEAAIVAEDILVPNAVIAAFPSNASQPVTNSDLAGDVIVVLGPDAPR